MLLALLLALPAFAGDGGLPRGLAADLRGYGVENLDGEPEDVHLGGRVRVVGTVVLLSSTLDQEQARRESIEDPRSVGIMRAGALLAICEQPREELAAHKGERLIVEGVLACEQRGRPCDSDQDGTLLQFWDWSVPESPTPVIAACDWALAPVGLPEDEMRALRGTTIETTDGSPLAVGAPVRVVGQGLSGKGGPRVAVWSARDGEDVWIRCGDHRHAIPEGPVEATGVLSCEPGLMQECDDQGAWWSYRASILRPQGRSGALPALESCRVHRAKPPRWTPVPLPASDLHNTVCADGNPEGAMEALAVLERLAEEPAGALVLADAYGCAAARAPERAPELLARQAEALRRALDRVTPANQPVDLEALQRWGRLDDLRATAAEARARRAEALGLGLLAEEVGTRVHRERLAQGGAWEAPQIDQPGSHGEPRWEIPRYDQPATRDAYPRAQAWGQALPPGLDEAPTAADLAALREDLAALAAERLRAAERLHHPLELARLLCLHATILLRIDDLLRLAPPGPPQEDPLRRWIFDQALCALDHAQNQLAPLLTPRWRGPEPEEGALSTQRWLLDQSRHATRGALVNAR
ncbi:MAG: hypothetical protein ABIO70_33260 [Pseudomonadota bacterium]